MLPGKSSMPVSRQPIPRMWPSPSPRILSQTPWRISDLSLNGSRGLRLGLRVNLSPSSSGQKFQGTTPSGLNMTTSRFFLAAWLAKPRLGRFSRNGTLAAPRPKSRRKSRRDRVWATVTSPVRCGRIALPARPRAGDDLGTGRAPGTGSAARRGRRPPAPFVSSDRLCKLGRAEGDRHLRLRLRSRSPRRCRGHLGAGRRSGAQSRLGDDLDQELADLEAARGERAAKLHKLLRAIRADGLLDDLVEQLLDERLVRLLVRRQELGQLAGAPEGDGLAGAGLVAAGRVDRLAGLLLAEPADGVVVLEREAERVDHPVARLAGRRVSLERDALAGR